MIRMGKWILKIPPIKILKYGKIFYQFEKVKKLKTLFSNFKKIKVKFSTKIGKKSQKFRK